ncbi:DNA primase family protein [Actinomadura formosensis]|uniref:DNA primase family protein n=1 Tax=Actinomadura formosensis TaxID=60706 RepID=UPI0008343102|nr:phage/plasmid primase, P4 family [Actinomadura formosensis]
MSELEDLMDDRPEPDPVNLRKPLSEYLPSDWGRAELLRDRHNEEMFWVTDGKTGEWRIYDNEGWRKDEDGLVDRWAKEAVQELIEDAEKRLSKAREAGDENALKEAQRARTYAYSCTNRAKIRAMLETARTVDKGRTVPRSKFDADPTLLGTENGTLGLLKGGALFGPSARTDFISRRTGTPYRYGAQSKMWDRYRETFLPDKEMEHFLQRLAGYGMVGGNPDGLWVILHGGPNSGKSTFLNMIGAALGDYASGMNLSSLRGKFDAGPREDVAAILPARFALASELSEVRELHADQIKMFTGSDPISFERKFGAQETLLPQFLPMVATNTMPRVRGADQALASRICVVPFSHSVPRKTRVGSDMAEDPDALAAFLAWMVEGWDWYCAYGLGRETWPESVLAAGAEYEATMTEVAAFIAEACEVGPDLYELAAATGPLFQAYTKWCENGNSRGMTHGEFSGELTNLGYERGQKWENGKNNKIRRGLALRKEWLRLA